LIGSEFPGSQFHFTSFSNTHVSEEILDNNCPSYDNLKRVFARSLRTNFSSLGNNEGANKAIKIELDSTKSHLYKKWRSNESYYRTKYKGWSRFYSFFQWLGFKLLEFIWGNGESILKLARSIIILLFIMTLYDVFRFRDSGAVLSYWTSFKNMPSVLLSITKPYEYSNSYVSIIYFVRLIAFGLFMAILIKRFNKR